MVKSLEELYTYSDLKLDFPDDEPCLYDILEKLKNRIIELEKIEKIHK